MEGLVIGKFLPPHKGHQLLIDFARNWPAIERLHVLVAGSPGEPIRTETRFLALHEHYHGAPAWNDSSVIVTMTNKIVPQYPEEDPNFWDMWVDLVRSYTSFKQGLVFASDSYGQTLAEKLDSEFIPVDIGREIAPMSGTVTRLNLAKHFHSLLPTMKKNLAKRVVLFGADSVGKTTLAERLGGAFDVPWIREYARGYLDHRGVTAEAGTVSFADMCNIASGQYAIQWSIRQNPPAHYVFFDTDLYTTMGYCELFGHGYPPGLMQMASQSQADFYLVLDTAIPFVPDAQRYGGDARQSSTQFWLNICEQFNLPHALVKTRAVEDRVDEIVDILIKHLGHASLI